MSVSVGQVYPITAAMQTQCGSIQSCRGKAAFVRIMHINESGSLVYDILDNGKVAIDRCSICISPAQLDTLLTIDTPLTTSSSITGMAMSIMQQFRLSMKGEPEKTFIKAGIIDNDEKFTSEGKELFNAFLLHKFGDEFKKEVVDPLLEEMKESK